MSHGDGRYDRSGMPMPHPCQRCGQPTIYLRCDACHTADLLNQQRPFDPQDDFSPPLPAPSSYPPLPQMTWQAGIELFNACLRPGEVPERTLDDVAWLIDTRQIGGALDGDEFRETIEAVRLAPEQTPQLSSWSGICPWCVREVGAVGDHPPLARMQVCYRHRMALRRLNLLEGKGVKKGGAA